MSKQQVPVVWVAGVGASVGLGAALARRFVKAGFTAAITGRNADRLQGVAAEIRAAGGNAVALPGDVSRESEVLSLAQRVAEIGELRVGVFNAGNADRAPSLELRRRFVRASMAQQHARRLRLRP